MIPELRGLYAVTPDQPDDEQLLAEVSAVLAGGCRWLQYRDKISAPAQRLARARQLATLCQQHDAALMINDDVELALAVDAAGVHLGRNDGDIAAARARLGDRRIIGASCYADYAMAQAAERAGADYVAFGAVFPSATKPNAAAAPLELFRRAHCKLALPLCAIGGITLANAPVIIAAGADLIAVITDLFAVSDVAGRATAFQHLFKE